MGRRSSNLNLNATGLGSPSLHPPLRSSHPEHSSDPQTLRKPTFQSGGSGSKRPWRCPAPPVPACK